jgi:hypothetical protein
MEQKSDDAAVMDVTIKSSKEECAGGMGQIAHEESVAFFYLSAKFFCQ